MGLSEDIYVLLTYLFVSARTWFIRYICYWHFQFLNNVIIIKAKVVLSQAPVTLADFGDPV